MAQLRCTNVAFCCNGCTPFSVDGANGRLLEVTDDLSCSIFSANTIAGLPVIEAFANYCVSMGQYGGHKFEVTCTSIRGGKCTTASGIYSFVGGGCCNTASNYANSCGAVVVGGFNNCSISSSSPGTCLPSFVGGGRNNCAVGGTIAGGLSNSATSPYTFIGGGGGNTTSGYGAVIVGGGCSAFSSAGNAASGNYSFIGGGAGNSVSQLGTAIVGGCGNSASGYFSFVGGGGCWSTTGAGPNTATGGWSAIVGGATNTASGGYSFIGGGQSNSINFVSNYSYIGGGSNNFINGIFSGITGGCNNFIDGPGPTTPATNIHIIGSGIYANTNNYTYVNNLCQVGGGISDCRVKNTIQPLEFGLDHLTQLQPVSWCWNGDASCHKKYGFIAQNVQQAMSCVVTCNKLHRLGSDGTQQVGGDGDPLLEFEKDAVYASYVNAFKELKKENDELKSRVEKIEAILKANNLL